MFLIQCVKQQSSPTTYRTICQLTYLHTLQTSGVIVEDICSLLLTILIQLDLNSHKDVIRNIVLWN